MSAPPRFDAAPEPRSITLKVGDKVFAGLVDMARKAGRTPSLQAQLLFDAAYAARCKPTGDADLDEAVARIDARGGEIVPPRLVPAVREALAAPVVLRGEPLRPERIFGADEAVGPVTVVQVFEAAPAKLEIVQSAAPPVFIPAQEETHAENAETEGSDVQGPVPGAEDAGPPLAEAEAEGPVVPAAGGDEAIVAGASVPDRDAEDLAALAAPPSTEAPPAEPSPAQVKLIRQLRSIGNTTTEIADILGVPADQVRAVLGQGKRR